MRGPWLLYAFFVFGAFGTLNMIPHEAVGGLNLSAQTFCALFLIAKILLAKGNPGRAMAAALDPARLGVLFIFLAYGFLSAYVMPRLFAHLVEVIPIAVTLPWAVPLEPTAANFTQPRTMALSVGMTLAFTLVGGSANFRDHYLQALLLGGLVLIATGLVDMTMASLGLADLLEPFRNVSGNPLVDDHMLGAKRVVGLMPEASSYGGVCCEAAVGLTFLRPCFHNRLRDLVVPPTILGLIAMAMLSTSSTAYVGLIIFAVIFAMNWLRRFLAPDALGRDALKWEGLFVFAAALALLVVVTLAPAVLDPAYAMIDEVIFQKSESGSYVERTMWTRVGLDAFFATDGIGVGLGSARTSNWYVAILANTGVIGAMLLATFIAQVMLTRSCNDKGAAEFMTALKFSLLPSAVMLALAGTTPDFGAGGRG